MKRNFRLCVLCLLCSVFFVPVDAQTMTIKFFDGTSINSLVSSVKKLTFSGSSVIVQKTDATSDTYGFSSIGKLTFLVSTGTDDPLASATNPCLYPNPATSFFFIKNIQDEAMLVSVFNLDGSLLLSTRLSSTDERVDIGTLSKGIYIVKVNGTVLKLIKL
jgi:hypothetical protein